MKKRPLILWIIGLGLIVSPIFYYVQEGAATQTHLLHFKAVLGAIPATKVLAMLLGPVVGLGVILVRPWSWYAFVAYCGLTMAVNAWLATQYNIPWVKAAAFMATGFFFALYFVRQEIKSPYFNPRLRWWETAQRYPLHLQVDIEGESSVTSETFDISETGCFLVTSAIYPLGIKMPMTIRLGDEVVSLVGEVVWQSQGRGRIPPGLGIRFQHASRTARRRFRGVLKRVASQQRLDNSSSAA